MIPQRVLNAYSKDSSAVGRDGAYKEGDFLVRFHGCDRDTKRSCEKELDPYYNLWAKKLKNE